MGGMGTGMGFGFGWMWIVWALVIAVIVFVVASLARGSRRSSGGAESPEEILKRRYAQGEIDQLEYQKRLQDLRH